MTTLLYAQIAQLLVKDGFELTSLIFTTGEVDNAYEAIYRKGDEKVVLRKGMELTPEQIEATRNWTFELGKGDILNVFPDLGDKEQK